MEIIGLILVALLIAVLAFVAGCLYTKDFDALDKLALMARVRDREHEACALIADDLGDVIAGAGVEPGGDDEQFLNGYCAGCREVAEAIRETAAVSW